MRSALLSLAIWSLQLCYGTVAAAKSTHRITICQRPGDTIYSVDMTGAVDDVVNFQLICLYTAVLAKLTTELQLVSC